MRDRKPFTSVFNCWNKEGYKMLVIMTGCRPTSWKCEETRHISFPCPKETVSGFLTPAQISLWTSLFFCLDFDAHVNDWDHFGKPLVWVHCAALIPEKSLPDGCAGGIDGCLHDYQDSETLVPASPHGKSHAQSHCLFQFQVR